jgi:hypothetical protein
LSKQNTEKLKEAMKASRERKVGGGDRPPPTCYACGEKGHISTYCPMKENKTETVVDTKTAKTVKQNDSEDSMRAMHEHTKNMTDDQVKLYALAHSWPSARLKARARMKPESPGQVSVGVVCVNLRCLPM